MGQEPTGLFRRPGTYIGLFIKGAVLSNNLKFSGQVPILPDDKKRKVLTAVAPRSPASLWTVLCSCLGRFSQ